MDLQLRTLYIASERQRVYLREMRAAACTGAPVSKCWSPKF
jgi:hypothetical protein